MARRELARGCHSQLVSRGLDGADQFLMEQSSNRRFMQPRYFSLVIA